MAENTEVYYRLRLAVRHHLQLPLREQEQVGDNRCHLWTQIYYDTCAQRPSGKVDHLNKAHCLTDNEISGDFIVFCKLLESSL